jgi:hypothetical protein
VKANADEGVNVKTSGDDAATKPKNE